MTEKEPEKDLYDIEIELSEDYSLGVVAGYKSGYSAGWDVGYDEGVEDNVSYQNGQVLMRNKCLQVIQKYYGSSVYDYLREKIMKITLEE